VKKDGRKVFYGMMILEAVIAMIWQPQAMSPWMVKTLVFYQQMEAPAAVKLIKMYS
jgi:carbon starvation protein CstA